MSLFSLPAMGKTRNGQNPQWAKPALVLTALSLIGLATVHPATAQTTTVYSNDFSSGAGSEWSNHSTDTTPGTLAHPADNFLGQFGHETTTLTLNGLVTHTQATVTFDIYIIRSMDGNGPDGPDSWSLKENGSTLIYTNFATATLLGQTQDFGGPNGTGGYLTGGKYAPYTGATEKNTLGFIDNGQIEDAVFHLSFAFTDPSSTLSLSFIGGQDQDISDESWGLDNVVVTTNAPAAVPEAGTSVSLGLMLALGVGGVAVARKRKASASAE